MLVLPHEGGNFFSHKSLGLGLLGDSGKFRDFEISFKPEATTRDLGR